MYLMSYNSVSDDTGGAVSLEYEVGQLLGLARKTEAKWNEPSGPGRCRRRP